ncbi:MAG: hypothetical protein IT165_33580 [Bryobacterales bacterium]|nr:hypothetical protein [Bryobacterales bacterium]
MCKQCEDCVLSPDERSQLQRWLVALGTPHIIVFLNDPQEPSNNRFNPDPSKVKWGGQNWEEMMIGWFDYTIDSKKSATMPTGSGGQ